MPGTPGECNACGSPLEVRFASVLDPQTRETFAIHSCTRCGLGHTTPQPADLSGYYGAAYQPIEYLLLASAVVINVLLPQLARAHEGDVIRFTQSLADIHKPRFDERDVKTEPRLNH